MADYWKSNAKKFCDFCKIWIADNKASVNIHENGRKHKDAVKAKLFTIKKQQEEKKKEEKIFEATMKVIEQAAAHAMHRDLTSNTSSLEQYGVKRTTETPQVTSNQTTTSTIQKESQAQKRKIDDKPHLESKIGEWKTVQTNQQSKKIVDLQLPSGNKMVEKLAQEKQSNQNEFNKIEQEMNLLNRQIEKKNKPSGEESEEIKEKVVTLKTSSSSSGPITFKKRKIEGHSMRSRTND